MSMSHQLDKDMNQIKNNSSEMDLDQFSGWFTEYWTTQLWDYYLQRGAPPSAPVQLFALGGTFSAAATRKNGALQKRFSTSNLNAEELINWLDKLRFMAAGEHNQSSELTGPVSCQRY